MAASITLDEMLGQLPKMMRVADDMHRMTNYIGDLRLLTFFIAGTSYIGVFCFLVFRYCQYRKKRDKKYAAKCHQRNMYECTPEHMMHHGSSPQHAPIPAMLGNGRGKMNHHYGRNSCSPEDTEELTAVRTDKQPHQPAMV